MAKKPTVETPAMKSAHHDPITGKFIKGNSAATGDKRLRGMKSAIRSELIECAYSLLKPYKTLAEETKKGVSRYQYILNKAVAEGNTKLITWVTEMAVGRPKIVDETANEDTLYIAATKEQQTELVKMAMKARDAKEKEENR